VSEYQCVEHRQLKDKRSIIIFVLDLSSQTEECISEMCNSNKNIPTYIVNVYSEHKTLARVLREQSLVKIVSAFPLHKMAVLKDLMASVIKESQWSDLTDYIHKQFSHSLNKRIHENKISVNGNSQVN